MLDFWPTRYRLEVPTTLGSINLLEQVTEFRGTLYWLDYWFLVKGDTSETARWKGCLWQAVRERAWSFHDFFNPPLSLHLHMFTNSKTLQISLLSLWIFMEFSLQRHDWLNHRLLEMELNLQLLSPPQRRCGGVKRSGSPSSTTTGLDPPLATRCHLSSIASKSHVININGWHLDPFSSLREF